MGGEEREDLAADPVTQELGVPVSRVLDPRQSACGEVAENRGPLDTEEGTHEPAAARGDAGKPPGSGALEEPHQDGLGLVVGGVPHGDPVGADTPGHPEEGRVAGGARRRLRGHARPTGDDDALDGDGPAEVRGEAGDEAGIVVGFWTEPVVDVADGEAPALLGGELGQRMEERDGVGAAGDGDQQPGPGRNGSLPGDGRPYGGEEGAGGIPGGRAEAPVHGGGIRPQRAGGDSPWSPTQTEPSSKISRFQMGTSCFRVSMAN